MRKLLVLASLLATAVALAVAPGASAGPVKGAPVSAGGPGVQSGYECAVSGVSFLIRNNLLLAVARNGLNPADFGGSLDQTLSLATVVRLHLTNPELFAYPNPAALGPAFNWCAR